MGKVEKLRTKINADRLLRIFFFAAFTGISVMLFWKCRYGYGNLDEAFYLTMPYRFLQGDRMVLHEWHMAQFSAFTMIPLMWVYRLFQPSVEGMMLAFRYIYTAIWCVACLYFDLRLRKIHKIGAGFVSLILLAYAPHGMMALSYNTLLLLYLMNAFIFLLCAEKHQKVQFALSGLFFAGAVLCNPYFIVIYLLASAVLLVAKVLKKTPVIPFNHANCHEAWLYFTIGAGSLAVILAVVVFSGASPEQIIQSFTFAMDDPEHYEMSLSEKLWDYYAETVRYNGYIRPMIAGIIGILILTLARRSALWPAAVCGIVAVYLWKFVKPGAAINYLMYPLGYTGIYVMLATRDTRIRWVGWIWLLTGVIGTLCLSFTSATGFYAIAHAGVISSLAGVMMLWMYCDELRGEYQTRAKWKKLYLLAPLGVLALMIYQLGVEVPVRYETVYWEEGLMEDSAGQVLLTEGPQKGVIASEKYAEEYLRTYRDIEEIHHQKVLFLSHQTWLPLANENENAAFSSWLSVYRYGMNQGTFDRLDQYYQICPDKRPEIIFLDQRYADQVTHFDPDTYEIRELESGNYLIRKKRDA